MRPEKLTPRTITSRGKLRDELRAVARQARSGIVAAAIDLGCDAGRITSSLPA